MPHPNWDDLVPDEQQPWETLEQVTLSPAPRLFVRDRVRLHTGTVTDYTYRPRGPRAVFVLPVTDAGEAVLIRQYRYPLRAWISEIVAGGIEPGEDVLGAARRELQEEIGGEAREWLPLPAVYPQPSISGVVFLPVLALGVTLSSLAPHERGQEESELIRSEVVPLTEAYRRLHAGEIHDATSSLVLFHARPELERRGLL